MAPANVQDVELRVRKVIADSLCVELDEVQASSNLINDLGAESIDFLDIMFRLEKEFEVKIPQREIERQARGDMPPEEFEVEGILQPKGIERLRQLIPEIDPAGWREGIALRELPGLFNVAVFAGIVKRKLEDGSFSQSAEISGQVKVAGT